MSTVGQVGATPADRRTPLAALVAFASTFRDIAPLPPRLAAIHRSGTRPHRVLLVGGGVLEGWGLVDHNLGLPGFFADELAARTRRGVDLDVVVEPNPTDPAAIRALRALRLRRFDAVIVVLPDGGSADAARPARWATRFAELTDLLLAETSSVAPLFVVDPAVASNGHARTAKPDRSTAQQTRRAGVTRRICAVTPRIRYVALPIWLRADGRGGRSSVTTYRLWARVLMHHVAPSLEALDHESGTDRPSDYRTLPDDESFRQRAVDALHVSRGHDVELDATVRDVRQLFQTTGAAINIIDGTTQWQKASIGLPTDDLPREIAFCASTLTADDYALFPDMQQDPKFVGHPLVGGPDGARFYLGFPIHTWDGYRVGALCVIDTEPREVSPAEVDCLRDSAARVADILWQRSLEAEGV